MPNDLLIAEIRKSGLELHEVADIAEVDPRTVQRWLAGRLPHPRYRQKLTAALGATEGELWPQVLEAARKPDTNEIVAAWPQRRDPDAPDWRALLRGANEVDLLGYTLSQITDTSGAIKQLRTRSAAGTQIRISIADPDGPAARSADQLQRPPGRLIPRIVAARQQLLQLAPTVALRQHQIATTHTLLRFDDELLLTIHTHGTPGFQAPLLHLRREQDYGIFDQLAKHFEDIWTIARPFAGAGLRADGPAVADDPETVRDRALDDLLDNLDNVWRPGRPQ